MNESAGAWSTLRAGQRVLVIGALGLLVAGCGPVEVACTEIGVAQGVGLEVLTPSADEASRAHIEVCWEGTCHSGTVELMATSTAVPGECDSSDPDGSCSAQIVTGEDKTGFLDVSNLPETEVTIEVVLEDLAGRQLMRDSVVIVPERIYPNGQHCDNGGVQTQVVVDGAGELRARN